MRRRRFTRPLLGAVLALAGCAKSVEEWQQGLDDEDPFERTLAVTALGRTGDPEVVNDLFAALADEDEGVGLAARQALAAMGPVAVPRLLEGLATEVSPGERGRLISATLLMEIGAPAVPPMIEALRDGTQHARAPIAVTLGRMGGAAVMPLAELLQAPDPDLAAVAARGLAETGPAGRAALPSLARAIDRPEPEVVVSVASALQAIGPDHPQALAALLARARTTDDEVHEVVLRAAVRGLLLQHLSAGDDPERERVRAEARELGVEAIGGLIVALKSERDEVAQLACDWLGEMGPDVLEPMLSAIGERNVVHIERAGRVVRGLGAASLPVLLALSGADDPSLRIKAVTAVVALGQDAVTAMPELLALLDHEDLDLAVAAAWALAQMVPPDAALLEQVIAALPRQTAMARRTLMPCPVMGLLARIDTHPDERETRLRQLRGLGTEAITVLQGLIEGGDPRLADQARRALRALRGE